MRIYSWGSTDVGVKRDHNEDSYLMLPDLNLYMVADGMGGHAGGEMASGMSVRVFHQLFLQNKYLVDPKTVHEGKVESSPVAKLLSDCIRASSNMVYNKGQVVPELREMGTTVVGLCFHRDYAFVAHVGDSRCYLIRDEKVLQLTDDHSFVNEQLKAGHITEAQAEKSRFKNVITRSVGYSEDVDVDRLAVETKPHDIFLVCSDGLTGLVTNDEIQEVVSGTLMANIPDVLINMANSRGGDDNCTVVIAYVADELEPVWDDAAERVVHNYGGASFNSGVL